MQRVLELAQQRETRRLKALRALDRQKTLERERTPRAVAAWNAARELASRLVEQARELVLRLKELAKPERVLSWAREAMQKMAPARQSETKAASIPTSAVAREREAVLKAADKTAAVPEKPARLDPAELSIVDQARLYNRVLDMFTEQQKAKIEKVSASSQARLQRRQQKARLIRQLYPIQPQGLLAGLKQAGYRRDLEQWRDDDHHARQLVDQAEALGGRLREAPRFARRSALAKLERRDPAFVERVQRYGRLQEQLQGQHEQAERDQKPVQKDRGRSL